MIQLEVWGPYALFSRPEFKTERVSYEAPTPSAVRGIFESIFWHPGMKYVPDRIHLLRPMGYDEARDHDLPPINLVGIRRNEVTEKISARNVRQAAQGSSNDPLFLATSKNIVQRASLVLKDVHYVIEAHFDMTPNASPADNPGKFQDIIKRRIARGQFYSMPYFGCREFPAHFRHWTGGEIPAVDETRDLGMMLYDFDYSDPQNITPTYFHAKLEHGVLDLRDCEVIR